MKFTSDIDIDFANRQKILSIVKHVSASLDATTAHNTGVYVTDIPVNPLTGCASIDYRTAEQRGYIKLDFLNVHVYNLVDSEQHLVELMSKTPPWARLYEQSFCEQIVHIGNHYNTLLRMPEPVTGIVEMMMFLAIIRPAKRHLIGKPWDEVGKTIWAQDSDGFSFKRSHACAYAHLVAVHMNLLDYSSN